MREFDDELIGDEAGLGEEGLAGLSTDWSVPWSDLMMVMFVVFVVLYSYQLAERDVLDAFRDGADVEVKSAPSFDTAPTRGLLEESQAIVEASELDDVEVFSEDGRVRVVIRGSAFFDLGKAELKPETLALLADLAPLLRKNRNEIQVVGHTDTFPIHSDRYPTNWELSVARATRVARHLIEQGGLEPGRFTVMGHSMYRPAVPNDSPENKAKNRRVEIVITRKVYRR